MSRIEVFSPAKINLFLAVVGRRADGFHELVSVVAQTEFGDDLELEELPASRGIELACDEPSIPADGTNLAWRAAEAFFKRYGIGSGLRIRLRKRIPSGAGFGGGSGNAAAALLGLRELFGVGSDAELSELAAGIGSDCPLFLQPKPVVMRGRGEQVEILDAASAKRLAGLPVALFKPSAGVSTVWAYRELASLADGYASACAAEERLDAWRIGAMETSALLANSFERPVFGKYPGIAAVLEGIREREGIPALLSGSGSGCFALADGAAGEGIRGTVERCWGARAFFQQTRLLGA